MRARVLAARALVGLAKLLIGNVGPALEVENDDEGLPLGHPVVLRSAVAARMVAEGSRSRPEAAPVPEVLPRGSLRARMAASRRTT